MPSPPVISNGDGHPDLVVANFSANGTGDGILGVLLGNGDGTFQPAVSYDSGGIIATSVAITDVNGDGRPDLVVANECNTQACKHGVVAVLLGNGDGTFKKAMKFPAGITPDSVVVADVNGDGKPDAVVADFCADLQVRLRGARGCSARQQRRNLPERAVALQLGRGVPEYGGSCRSEAKRQT